MTAFQSCAARPGRLVAYRLAEVMRATYLTFDVVSVAALNVRLCLLGLRIAKCQPHCTEHENAARKRLKRDGFMEEKRGQGGGDNGFEKRRKGNRARR